MGNGSITLRGMFPELPVAVVVEWEKASLWYSLLYVVVVAAPAASSVVRVVSVEMKSRFLSFLSSFFLYFFISFSKDKLVTNAFLSSMGFVEKRTVCTLYVCVYTYMYVYMYIRCTWLFIYSSVSLVCAHGNTGPHNSKCLLLSYPCHQKTTALPI